MSDTPSGSPSSSQPPPPSVPPTPSAPPPGVPWGVPESVLVEGNRPCIKCSYNLANQPVTGVCPACGSMVAESLRGILIRFASPEYLRTIVWGLSLVLNGILLSIVITAGSVLLGLIAISSGGGGSLRAMSLVVVILTQVTSIVILLGYWRFTEPDSGFVGLNDPSQARQLVRVSVGVLAVIQLIYLVNFVISPPAAGPGDGFTLGTVIEVLVGLLSIVCGVVQGIGVMLYTRWVASRIPDSFVIARANRYLWLLPVLQTVGMLVLVGPLIALVLYWNLLNRVRNHIKSIIATGSPSGAAA